jgi:hypothetical protein
MVFLMSMIDEVLFVFLFEQFFGVLKYRVIYIFREGVINKLICLNYISHYYISHYK